MNHVPRLAARLILTCAIVGSSIGQAYACGEAATSATDMSSTTFVPAVYNAGTSFTNPDTSHALWSETSSIVGLWEFEVRLNGAQNGLPDNALLDWGLATWHHDGTEIQFSGSRPPSSGDVCMGVWREDRKHVVLLHHVALGLTPATASGTFVGPTIIKAAVHVEDDGNAYSGPYSLTVYPGSPDNGTEFDERGKPLVTFNATVRAKRVKVP